MTKTNLNQAYCKNRYELVPIRLNIKTTLLETNVIQFHSHMEIFIITVHVKSLCKTWVNSSVILFLWLFFFSFYTTSSGDISLLSPNVDDSRVLNLDLQRTACTRHQSVH